MADQFAVNLSREGAVSPASRRRRRSVVAALAIALTALAAALFWLRPAHPDGARAAHVAEAVARGEEAYRRGDVAGAIALWREAAEAGNAAAENELGLAFENGRGMARDYRAALRLFRQAAAQGYAPAMTELGGMRLTEGEAYARASSPIPRPSPLLQQACQRRRVRRGWTRCVARNRDVRSRPMRAGLRTWPLLVD